MGRGGLMGRGCRSGVGWGLRGSTQVSGSGLNDDNLSIVIVLVVVTSEDCYLGQLLH